MIMYVKEREKIHIYYYYYLVDLWKDTEETVDGDYL